MLTGPGGYPAGGAPAAGAPPPPGASGATNSFGAPSYQGYSM